MSRTRWLADLGNPPGLVPPQKRNCVVKSSKPSDPDYAGLVSSSAHQSRPVGPATTFRAISAVVSLSAGAEERGSDSERQAPTGTLLCLLPGRR